MTKLSQDYRTGSNAQFVKDVTPYAIIYIKQTIAPEDVSYMAGLEYKKYLYTVYWRLVRAFKILLSDGCELCQRTNRLNVHHATYDNKGREYEHLDDLHVLCKGCHEGQHMDNAEVFNILKTLATSKHVESQGWKPKDNDDYNPHAIQQYLAVHGDVE